MFFHIKKNLGLSGSSQRNHTASLLIFFFLFVLICNLIIKISFLKPREPYFLAGHSSIVMAIVAQRSMFNFLKSRALLWFI